MNKVSPKSEGTISAKKKPWLKISLAVVLGIILLWVGVLWWNAKGPGVYFASKGVNQAVKDVNPWQFGKVVSSESAAPDSDQQAAKDFIMVSNSSPQEAGAKIEQELKNDGFKGDGGGTTKHFEGFWLRSKNGKSVSIAVVIEGPGHEGSVVSSDKTELHITFNAE